LSGIVVTCARQSRDRVDDPRRLVSLAAKRNGRKVRRVGLDQQPVARNQAQQIFVRPFLEGDDSAKGHVPARIESEFCQMNGTGIAMQHADDVGRSRFTNKTTSVLLRITGVHHERFAHLVSDL